LLSAETVNEIGPIEPEKEEIRSEPYSLPSEFQWDTLDLANSKEVC